MTNRTARVKDCPSMGNIFRIGLSEAVAISRVEGLVVSQEMARMFRGFVRDGICHDVRRAILMARFGRLPSDLYPNNKVR